MSPWLFNVYMDGVVREGNARVQGRTEKVVVRKGTGGWSSIGMGRGGQDRVVGGKGGE